MAYTVKELKKEESKLKEEIDVLKKELNKKIRRWEWVMAKRSSLEEEVE